MSEKKKDGGPAYPGEKISERIAGAPTKFTYYPGMTLRDYFAGQALAGLLSGIKSQQDIRNNYHHAAYEAYGYADAMIAERDK